MEDSKARLGKIVERLLAEKGWSLRLAQGQTGVSFNVIDRMIKGAPVETHSLFKFVVATAPKGQLTARLLEYLSLAGKEDIVDILATVQLEAFERISAVSSLPLSAEELTLRELMAKADPVDRELARRILQRSATAWKPETTEQP